MTDANATQAAKAYCRIDDLDDIREDIVGIRRHIHQHPELSFQEADTAALVAARLEEWGYAVTRNIGGNGLVGTLRVGGSPRSIGLRADMDALPITEQTGLAYASRTHGAMHACGHDGHTAMLLGAARQLARTRNFDGTLHLIFQPAEEAGFDSGAQKMLEDRLFERFPCDAVFGIHNHPGVAAGTFMFRSGPFMAACDTVKIKLVGKGSHAARPHLSVDPVVTAASLVMALQTVVSRNVDPMETAVVTVGSLHAGNASNVIPEYATLELSVRSFKPEVRELLETRIRALVETHAASYGAHAEIDYLRGYPVLVNSDAETEFARNVALELVGEENVIAPFGPIAGSEDFAYFLQQRPGCFLRVGNGQGRPMLHNAHYDFNDENIPVGAAYWTRLVERWLAGQPG
ncbi:MULTISPECIES: M20 aminoacylase family protein [unclassified Herbaspirillum]|uniref:M20 aminoacylase family protein n=1 Tax=unclassified Herbaspirillum TaxID=2624150 RepID=UPI0011746854|nr:MULTISPECIES: M20 aminoacylase family protein [unclassified Herbaspirillum]MBB5392022.1 hippurate hydrolase [Herbaspirillum sp. SJZ102]TQK13482.1 hippurate hydrolase [Herbaspirillum sp. SJZ130]TQK15485.1 hippurate hydrolase [Herbaspirillum sp. SJZ106]